MLLRSIQKKDEEKDDEDDTVDSSVVGESMASESDNKSEDSKAVEESDAESEAEADSSDDEASDQESEHDAEGEDDNEVVDSVKKNTHARSGDDAKESTLADDDSSTSIDREAEVTEEDKVGMRSPTFSDARVNKFIKHNNMDPKDYSSFHKSMKITKVSKHLTPQQSHNILQFIGKNLDPQNKTLPTTEEARTFLYFQELLFLFMNKERQSKKSQKGNGSKHNDGNYMFWLFCHGVALYIFFFYHLTTVLISIFYHKLFPFPLCTYFPFI